MAIGMGVAALLGGSSILSGLMGGAATRSASKQQSQIALANLMEQRAASERAQAIARRAESRSKEPIRDAQGNVWYYREGIGWQFVPSGTSAQLLKATEQEQLIRATREQELARETRDEEREIAEGLREQFKAIRPMDTNALKQMLIERSLGGLTKGFDTTQDRLMRQYQRTGASSENVLAQLMRERAEATSKAINEANIQATMDSDQRAFQKQQQLSNLYNVFANRASAASQPGLTPVNIGANVPGGGGINALQMQMMAGAKAPQMNYQVPVDTSGSKMMSGLTSLGAGYMAGQDKIDTQSLPNWYTKKQLLDPTSARWEY